MAIREIDEFYQGGGLLDLTRPIRFRAAVNICDRIEVKPDAVTFGDGFINIAGTFPIPPDEYTGVYAEFTIPEGSNNSGGDAVFGYIKADNNTGSGIRNGVFGFVEFHEGTGQACGVQGVVQGGTPAATGTRYGGQFLARDGAATGETVGTIGWAFNSAGGPLVGGWFRSGGTSWTPRSAGVASEAAGGASYIAIQGGVEKWSVENGGSVQGKMGTKTLTETVATAFVRISVP
jgi:hypothetical protein